MSHSERRLRTVADLAEEGDLAAMHQVRGWAYQDGQRGKKLRQLDALELRDLPNLAVNDDLHHDPAAPRALGDRITWAVERGTGVVRYRVDGRQDIRVLARKKALPFMTSALLEKMLLQEPPRRRSSFTIWSSSVLRVFRPSAAHRRNSDIEAPLSRAFFRMRSRSSGRQRK